MIFGIGLSKTGTNSLNEALTLAGHPSVHFPSCELMLAGKFDEAFNGAVAATDISVTAFYRELDETYPGSKFILTVRDRQSWLQSIETHMLRRPAESLVPGHPIGDVRQLVYGMRGFDRGAFEAAYDLHRAAVLAYFNGRDDDLLIMDVCGGDGWDVLCPFIGVRAPRRAFPSLNKTRVEHQAA